MKGTNLAELQRAQANLVRTDELLRRDTERREARRATKAKRTQARRLAASRPQKLSDELQVLKDAWYRWSLAAQCEVCREKPADEAHHVVREQTLRTLARDRGYDFQVIRWSLENRLLVCCDCHEPHTNASKRIHASKLRPENFLFIELYGFEHQVEREYDHSSLSGGMV